MLLTFLFSFFVDSLSNPIFIVTICVPKRRVKMIWDDYQVIMRFVLELEGVENEESMWKHSTKSKVVCQVRQLFLSNYVPSYNFFETFFDKSFVVSIIFCNFVGG